MSECGEGCATPLNTVGMGNPGAPDGEAVGSGDTFDHQKRTAKPKRRKKDKEIPDPQKDPHIVEGMFDDDFDITTTDILDNLLEEFAKIYKSGVNIDPAEYEDFYERFMKHCETIERPKSSLMKAFRSKDNTIVMFMEEAKKGNWLRTKQISIRKFISNPLPEEFQIYEIDIHGKIVQKNYEKRVNHPTTLDLRNKAVFVLPEGVYNKLWVYIYGKER